MEQTPHDRVITRGDCVRYRIPGRAGVIGTPTVGYVLGIMDYSADVALVANEQAHGMPVNVAHLTFLSCGHDVSSWTARYRSLYPNVRIQDDS